MIYRLFKAMLITMLLSASVFADNSGSIFDFVLTKYPRLQPQCEATAKSLAETFSQKTGLQVFKTECKQYDQTNDTITIWYAAPERMPFISTDSIRVVSTGFYASQTSCEQDLQNQTDLFRRETNLSPFLAYCFKDQSGGSHAFSSRIDALGPAAKFPYSYSGLVYGSPVESETAIVAELKNSLSRLGFEVSLAAIGNTFADGTSYELAIRYYSKFSADGSFDLRSFGSESSQVCLQQEAELRNALHSADISAATSFCVYDRAINRTSLESLLTRVEPWFREENVAGTYPSFSACELDKTRVVDFYRNSLGKDPFGAICVNDLFAPTYRMRVLSKCTPDNVTPACELGTDWSDPFPGLIPGTGEPQ